MAEEFSQAELVKVDVDQADDVAAHCGIRAMPTFLFLKDGAKVHEVMGADQVKLREAIMKFM